MAIKIESATGTGLIGKIGKRAYIQKVDICADTEAEITALPAFGQEVTDADDMTVIPAKNSIAYTADMNAIYCLSPSGIWTKVG